MEVKKKVGIIGLQPRQIADLEKIKFDIDLRMYREKSFDDVKVAAFYRDLDSVIVLASHTPRKSLLRAPSSKTTIIPGNVGLSSVIRHLETKYARIEETPIQSGIKPVAHYQRETRAASTEASRRLIEIDNSWHTSLLAVPISQYAPPITATTIERKTSSRYNFTTLLACKPGDVLRYLHGVGEDTLAGRDALRMRFYNALRVYTERCGYILEAHQFLGYTDILVTDRRYDGGELTISKYGTKKELEDLIRRNWLLTGTSISITFVGSKEVSIEDTVVELPPLEVAIQSTGQVEIADQLIADDPESIAFWKQAYLAALGTGAGNERAKRIADQAVSDLAALT